MYSYRADAFFSSLRKISENKEKTMFLKSIYFFFDSVSAQNLTQTRYNFFVAKKTLVKIGAILIDTISPIGTISKI